MKNLLYKYRCENPKVLAKEGLKDLKSLREETDTEVSHIIADEILLALIREYVPKGKMISKEFIGLTKYYS